jgi:potassium efflux system protein
LADRLQDRRLGCAGGIFWALLASLGQESSCRLAMVALSVALVSSGMLGETGGQCRACRCPSGLRCHPAFVWLGGRPFPDFRANPRRSALPAERRAEGRFLSLLMGLVMAGRHPARSQHGGTGLFRCDTSVMSFPILLAGGLLLLRMGRTLRRARPRWRGGSYSLRLIAAIWSGRAWHHRPCRAGAGGFGYVQAAEAMIYPAMLSLGAGHALLILQRADR